MSRVSRLLSIRSGLAVKPRPAPPVFRECRESHRHAKSEKKDGCPLPSATAGHVSDNWLRRRERCADHQPHVYPGGDLAVSRYHVQVIHNPIETFMRLGLTRLDNLDCQLRTVETGLPLSAGAKEAHRKTFPYPAAIECGGRRGDPSFGRLTIEFALDRCCKIDETFRVHPKWIPQPVGWLDECHLRLSPVHAWGWWQKCNRRQRHKKASHQDPPTTLAPNQTLQQIKTSLLSLTRPPSCGHTYAAYSLHAILSTIQHRRITHLLAPAPFRGSESNRAARQAHNSRTITDCVLKRPSQSSTTALVSGSSWNLAHRRTGLLGTFCCLANLHRNDQHAFDSTEELGRRPGQPISQSRWLGRPATPSQLASWPIRTLRKS